MLRVFLSEIVEAVYPAFCPVCDTRDCARHTLPEPRDGGLRCTRCATLLPDFFREGDRCAACLRRPPRFRHATVLGDYATTPGLRDWILALKHGARPGLAQPLGRALAARITAETAQDAAGRLASRVVPVPLHPLRRLERGYDQALLLARAVGDGLGLPVVRALRRRRWTVPQGTPGARSRLANVRGAFMIAERRAPEVAGRPVILVDDVLTSGATAHACAGELRRAGAGPVRVACLARAGPVDGEGPPRPC